MNVLVIGGTRFVGLHLVYQLLREGHQVTALNRGLTPGDLPPEVERLRALRVAFLDTPSETDSSDAGESASENPA